MAKISSRFTLACAACAAVVPVGQALAVAPGYSVTWLGYMDAADNYSVARDINAAGQVVGSSGVSDPSGYNNRSSGFLWGLITVPPPTATANREKLDRINRIFQDSQEAGLPSDFAFYPVNPEKSC